MKQSNHKQGLAPLVGPCPQILILGSLPSDESIRRQEYYGNPRNLFWKVIAGVYGEPTPEAYEAKKDILFRHGIALWDVCASAERKGSLDAVLNGGKAAKEFRRYTKRIASLGRDEFFFTSTSALSISAGWPLERIIEQWKQITAYEDI